MGFFSDLKDDLSQAVNELMTEEELEAALAAEESLQDNGTGESDSVITSEELSDMLDKVEAEALSAEEVPAKQEPEIAAVPENPEEPLPEEVPAQAEEVPTEEAAMVEAPVAEDVAIEETVAEEAAAEENAGGETMSEVEMIEEVQEEILPEEIAEEPALEEEQERKGGNSKMENKVVSDETAVVTEGMSITGDINSTGSLELIGNVVGNIDILGKLNITGSIQGNSRAAEIFAEGAQINGEINSQGSVKIGQSSVVIGNIAANSAVIAGAVKGDIDIHGPVVLDTSAIVMGNIKSKSVQINNGAVIEGMCSQCYADVSPSSFFEEIKKKKEK